MLRTGEVNNSKLPEAYFQNEIVIRLAHHPMLYFGAIKYLKHAFMQSRADTKTRSMAIQTQIVIACIVVSMVAAFLLGVLSKRKG